MPQNYQNLDKYVQDKPQFDIPLGSLVEVTDGGIGAHFQLESLAANTKLSDDPTDHFKKIFEDKGAQKFAERVVGADDDMFLVIGKGDDGTIQARRIEIKIFDCEPELLPKGLQSQFSIDEIYEKEDECKEAVSSYLNKIQEPGWISYDRIRGDLPSITVPLLQNFESGCWKYTGKAWWETD